MGLLDIDPSVIDQWMKDGLDYWSDFKMRFDIDARWLVKGEIPSHRIPPLGFALPKDNRAADFFCDLLRDECHKLNITLIEFDCRNITGYQDAVEFIRTLANGDGQLKMVHISHFTEIPDVPDRVTIGNLLVSSWKNPDIYVADVILDARPLRVYLSCVEGAKSDYNPWRYTDNLGWFRPYKKR